jgi:hypothetical protein
VSFTAGQVDLPKVDVVVAGAGCLVDLGVGDLETALLRQVFDAGGVGGRRGERRGRDHLHQGGGDDRRSRRRGGRLDGQDDDEHGAEQQLRRERPE